MMDVSNQNVGGECLIKKQYKHSAHGTDNQLNTTPDNETVSDLGGEHSLSQKHAFLNMAGEFIDDNPYDGYLLRKNMENVFQEIADETEKEKLQDFMNQNKGQAQAGSSDFMLHRKFEGGPHFNYLKPFIKKVRPSPNAEEIDFMTFYDSTRVIYNLLILPQ